MKIYSAGQIRNWDSFTVQNEGITSLQLMESAAQACTSWLESRFGIHKKYCILCGPGNNGGDGLAIARLLRFRGAEVTVCAEMRTLFKTPDALTNWKEIQQVPSIDCIDLKEFSEIVPAGDVIYIDALFGSGFKDQISGVYKEAVLHLNTFDNIKVSIDIPSGLSADSLAVEGSAILSADYTLTFQSLKKSFLHPETGIFCGKIHILDIGLSMAFDEPANDFAIDKTFIGQRYNKRNDFSHKGSFGKSLIVAGSYGKMGAAVLAVRAALKTGSGITVAASPACGYNIMQTSCPEAMFESAGENHLTSIPGGEEMAVGIGPGLGTHSETAAALANFLQNRREAILLDADALNILAASPELLRAVPPGSIITPHPKEFERLFGKSADSFARLKLARQQASDLNIYIVLKDHNTQVVTPEGNVYYNTTGNAGMAKGGSGDVLLGIITALIAQKYGPEDAALLGVWLHGRAGDLAAKKHSQEAMLATDLIDEIGTVFLNLAEGV